MLRLLILLCWVGSAATLVPVRSWLQEVNLSLSLNYVAAHVVLTGLLLIRWRNYSFPFLAAVFASGLTLSVYHLSFYREFFEASESTAPASFEKLRVFYANVFIENPDLSELRETIRDSGADYVAMVEFGTTADAALNITDIYPYAHLILRDDPFGIALYSRYPLRNVAPGDGVFPPFIVATVETPNGASFDLAVVHTLPPVRDRLLALSGEMITRLLRTVNSRTPATMVLIGDLNAAPNSGYYRRVKEGLQLQHGGRGHGVVATWNQRMPIVRVMIDHAFYRGNITPRLLAAGRDFGSDHLPLEFEFLLGANVTPAEPAG